LVHLNATLLSSPASSIAPMPAGSAPVVWLSGSRLLRVAVVPRWADSSSLHYSSTALHGLVEANDHY
jgi:hypothetical protein